MLVRAILGVSCSSYILTSIHACTSIGKSIHFFSSFPSDRLRNLFSFPMNPMKKARLPAMGVSPVVAPLADGETVQPMVLKRLLTMPSRRHEARPSHSWSGSSAISKSKASPRHSHHQQQVDVVFMTLWFWSTAPVPRDFLPLTRRFAPHAKVRIPN